MHKRVRWPRLARLRWQVTPIRRQAGILLLSLGGFIGFAGLIGLWAVGLAGMAVAVFGVWYALMRDVAEVQPVAESTHDEVIRRYRAVA